MSDPYVPTDTVVAICTPHKTEISATFIVYFEQMDKSFLGKDGSIHCRVIGRSIVDARNELTKNAMDWKGNDPARPKVTHFLWMDDDMLAEPDALKRLFRHDLPIVGGLCFNRRHPYQPTLAKRVEGVEKDIRKMYGWIYDYPQNTLLEVDATGGAFLLIKREVFEAIAAKEGAGPDWEEWWSCLPNYELSEDLSFCYRAQECGYKIFVDTGVKLGHIGEVVVDEDFANRNRRARLTPWVPPGVHGKEGVPVASVIIPTYNTEPRLLEKAIMSAVNQTVPVEVIVVNDGTEPVEGYQYGWDILGLNDFIPPKCVKLIHHPKNKGISAALNTGINNMTTDWFCWLSSDDYIDPEKVERQLISIQTAKLKAGFHGYVVMGRDRTSVVSVEALTWTDLYTQNRILSRACAINGSTTMIAKEVLENVRLKNGEYFDTDYKYGQDWEMWCRIGKKYLWHSQKESLGGRLEASNLTAKINESPELTEVKLKEDLKIMDKYVVPDYEMLLRTLRSKIRPEGNDIVYIHNDNLIEMIDNALGITSDASHKV